MQARISAPGYYLQKDGIPRLQETKYCIVNDHIREQLIISR